MIIAFVQVKVEIAKKDCSIGENSFILVSCVFIWSEYAQLSEKDQK